LSEASVSNVNPLEKSGKASTSVVTKACFRASKYVYMCGVQEKAAPILRRSDNCLLMEP
jgi:hypothetical protein